MLGYFNIRFTNSRYYSWYWRLNSNRTEILFEVKLKLITFMFFRDWAWPQSDILPWSWVWGCVSCVQHLHRRALQSHACGLSWGITLHWPGILAHLKNSFLNMIPVIQHPSVCKLPHYWLYIPICRIGKGKC